MQVFLSYARKDEALANAVAQQLKSRGVDVWVDREQVRSGEDWARAIDEAIAKSDAMIALLSPNTFSSALVRTEIERARDRWNTTDLAARMAKYHRDPEAAFLGWNGAWLDPGFPAVLDLQPEIAHVRIPILVVQGEADPYGTLEHLHIIERETYCPVDRLVLPGIGHSPHLEAPEATLGAVADFAHRLFRVHEPAL